MIFYDGRKVYMNGEYPAVFVDGKSRHIHRLEWEKYHGTIPPGCVIHHKDENKLNWSIENLELLTRSDHIKQHKNIVKRKGVNVIARKNNRELYFESIEKAAKYCGTYPASIGRAFKGKQRIANGWTFERM